jgi:hypothetical protein
MFDEFRQVALGGRTTGLSPAGAGLQAPAAALGPLAAGEVIGCGAVWRAGEEGQQRHSLEIFFHRDGLLVASISGNDLGSLMLRRQVFPTCFQRSSSK